MYIVEITIEFDEKPTDADVRKYLKAEIAEPKNLRWDLHEFGSEKTVLDAQNQE